MTNEESYRFKYEICLNWIAEKLMEDSSDFGMETSYEKALETAKDIVEDEMKWRSVNESMATPIDFFSSDRTS